MGVERNAQGAVPVALTLQQLGTNLSGLRHECMYFPSLELIKHGEKKPECEVDFVWIVPNSQREKISVILGECKDQGPIPLDEFAKDVENLRRVMDALPSTRFKAFALFSKLSAFTPDEIALAKSLNSQYDLRVILLTDRELEPYHVYERTEKEFDIKRHGGTPEDMALVTAQIYFSDVKPDDDKT